MNTPKINTRCPACGSSTLMIDDQGNLVCSLIGCPQPTLINNLGGRGVEIRSTLLNAAHDIRRLRQQIVETKADAWDIHALVISRLTSGSQVMSECPASRAENLAANLDGKVGPTL